MPASGIQSYAIGALLVQTSVRNADGVEAAYLDGYQVCKQELGHGCMLVSFVKKNKLEGVVGRDWEHGHEDPGGTC